MPILKLFLFSICAMSLPFMLGNWGYGNLGIFIGWELAAIIQSIMSYLKFSEGCPPRLSTTKKNNINNIILGVLYGCLFLFCTYKISIIAEIEIFKTKSFINEVLVFFVNDAITIIPMITFFVFNIYLNKKLSNVNFEDDVVIKYRAFIRKTIRTIDLPCLLPYLLIIVFSVIYKDQFDWSTFISGAGSVLLLTSNLLTDSLLMEKSKC